MAAEAVQAVVTVDTVATEEAKAVEEAAAVQVDAKAWNRSTQSGRSALDHPLRCRLKIDKRRESRRRREAGNCAGHSPWSLSVHPTERRSPTFPHSI